MATDYTKDLSTLMQQNTYTPSDDVNAAYAELDSVKAGKPAEYDSKYSDQLGSLYDQIVNAGNYSFDMSTDQLYNQYKQAYQDQGRKAAMDTLSSTNAMAGGYGTTWAQAAANQQYGEYLKGMNDVLPQIEQNAYNRYTSEQDRLSNLYQTTMNADNADYERYRQGIEDWQADREYAANAAQQAYTNDYNRYSDQLNAAQTMTGWNREDAQQQQSDAYSWALTLIKQGILPNGDILATAGISDADALELAKKYGYKAGGGSGGSSGKKKSGGGASSTVKFDSSTYVPPREYA